MKQSLVKSLLSLALLAATLMALGCGGEPSLGPEVGDDAVDLEDAEAKADAITYPRGTFRFSDPTGDQGKLAFVLLVLMKDGTFYRQAPTLSGVAGAVVEGTYKFSSSGGYRYVRFLDWGGALIDRYNWQLVGTTLTLRQVNTTKKYAFTQAAPFCTWWSHCDAQGLKLPGPGGWDCQASTCVYKPCAFGIYFENPTFQGAPGLSVKSKIVSDAAHPATGILLAQILDMLKRDWGTVPDFATALSHSQDANFQSGIVKAHDGNRYRVIWYYGGDNMVGAIYREAAVQQVAYIGDQSIYECKVP